MKKHGDLYCFGTIFFGGTSISQKIFMSKQTSAFDNYSVAYHSAGFVVTYTSIEEVTFYNLCLLCGNLSFLASLPHSIASRSAQHDEARGVKQDSG
jgi:glutaminase